jgi:threonine/homoserine/homoserine lactone efflux protein
LGDLLPFAAAIALSPFPVLAIILLLTTPRASANGVAFAVGWLVGLSAISVAFVAMAGAVGADDPGGSDGVAWGRLLLGIVLLAAAVKKWRGRPPEGVEPPAPAWMERLAGMGPRQALVLGLALGGLNPKNLALAAAAAPSIVEVSAEAGADAASIAVFVLLGSSTVLGAVGAHLALGERSAAALARVDAAMRQHQVVIVCVVLVIFGLKLVGDGLAGA